MRRSWVDSELAALAVCAGGLLVVGRGWLLDPGVGFVVRDTGFALVGVDWLQTALLHGADAWSTPLGWPLPDPTTLVDWMAGEAVLGLPFRLARWDPYAVHEALVALGVLLTAWTCHRAAAALHGRGPHTWVAAVIGGFAPAAVNHLQHVNLVHHELAVGGTVLLAVGLTERRPALAGLGAVLAVGAAHFGAYMGLHAALLAGGVGLLAAVGRLGDRRSWAAVGVGAVLAAATVAPVAARYGATARRDGIGVSAGEIAAESWDPSRTLAPLFGSPLHDAVFGLQVPEPPGPTPQAGPAPAVVLASTRLDPPNPGYLAAVLALVGLGARRRPRVPRSLHVAPALLLLACLLLALGPAVRWHGADTGIPGPTKLLDLLLGGTRLRAPARWWEVADLLVAVLAAGGLRTLVGARPPAWAAAIALGAVGIALAEAPRAEVGPLTTVAVEPAAARIDTIEGEGALYENHGRACPYGGEQQFHAALFHGRPLVGGSYARAFRAIQDVNQVVASWPSPEALVFLRTVGARVTYEHPPLRPLPPGVTACVVDDGHRVCALDPHVPPATFSTTPSGPVVGLRWPAPPAAAAVTVTCGDRVERVPPLVWGVLTRLRLGADTRAVEVYLDTPCPTVPTVDVGAPSPLYAASSTPWLPPPPLRPRRVADALE